MAETERGLRMFLMKLLFVVLGFSQFLGVLSTKGVGSRKTDDPLSPDTADLQHFCDKKTCQVSMCLHTKMVNNAGIAKILPAAASMQPGALESTEEPDAIDSAVINEYDVGTAYGKVRQVNGVCALRLFSAIKNLGPKCEKYCKTLFKCITLHRAKKQELDKAMESQLVLERQWMHEGIRLDYMKENKKEELEKLKGSPISEDDLEAELRDPILKRAARDFKDILRKIKDHERKPPCPQDN